MDSEDDECCWGQRCALSNWFINGCQDSQANRYAPFLHQQDSFSMSRPRAMTDCRIGFAQVCFHHYGVVTKVHRVSWWMRLYGSPTPKRHLAYCNSPAISKLDLGKLTGWAKKLLRDEAEGIQPVKTVQKYIDKSGKQRYKGTSALKPTESETYLFCITHVIGDNQQFHDDRSHRSWNVSPTVPLVVSMVCPALCPGTTLVHSG